MKHRLRKALERWVALGQPRLVRLELDDVIVVTVPGELTPAREAEIRTDLECAFGYHQEILVLGDGATLDIIRAS